MKECAAKGIFSAVIISSGFREMGEEGAQIEKEIIRIAAGKTASSSSGPNTMGIASAHHFYEALPTSTAAAPGGLAVISQSGNLGPADHQMDRAEEDIGLSLYAGTGQRSHAACQ